MSIQRIYPLPRNRVPHHPSWSCLRVSDGRDCRGCSRLAQNPDRIQNASWAATGLLIHGCRTPGPPAIIAKSTTVTVVPLFDGHDAGDRYRARGSNATITVPIVLDIRRLRALELMLGRPRQRAVYSGTSLDVASDHGILIEANRGERQESIPNLPVPLNVLG
jgi:hypothetical protein